MIWTSFTPPAEAGGYYMGGLRTCGILGLPPFAGQACSLEKKLPPLVP